MVTNWDIGEVKVGPGLVYFPLFREISDPLFEEIAFRREKFCRDLAQEAFKLSYKPKKLAERMILLTDERFIPMSTKEDRAGKILGALESGTTYMRLERLIILMDRWHMRSLIRQIRKRRRLSD